MKMVVATALILASTTFAAYAQVLGSCRFTSSDSEKRTCFWGWSERACEQAIARLAHGWTGYWSFDKCPKVLGVKIAPGH